MRSNESSFQSMVRLFEEWRTFERPVMKDGVPDYTVAAMTAKYEALPQWRQRLEGIDTHGWDIEQLNDRKLMVAEMNGLDFNLGVLRPWARDPAFYVSVWPARADVPSREAPPVYPEIELYNYTFPLSTDAQRELAARLNAVPVLLLQARDNLQDSNARDLWIFGAQELRNQSHTLQSLQAGTLIVSTLGGSQRADIRAVTPAVHDAINAARHATDDFVAWLEGQAPSKNGPSGIGKDNYTWYQQNVHLVPHSWADEVVLCRRELERALASLRLQEHQNRGLAPLEAVTDAAAYDRLTRQRLDKFTEFLVQHAIIPDKAYIKAALEPQLGHFLPEEHRKFFHSVMHREPMLLFSHWYHWVDLARMRDEPNPSPIRRTSSLYNIWDSRAEGFATAFEELLMHTGLYEDNPRAKELVWIMLANRAARGLASLYVQANELTLERAGAFHAKWTPRRMVNADDSLTAFEQLLYLRQPGYGTSYVIGKLHVERLIAEYAQRQELDGAVFVLRDFIDEFNGKGMMPMALIEMEMISHAAYIP